MEIITKEQVDKAMQPIWEIKNQIYEETKHMTIKERLEYYHQKSEKFLREMEEADFSDCDLSFLHKKKEDENQ